MPPSSHPTVRGDLHYARQIVNGKPSYVVKDRARQQYFRFGEVEVWLMQRMDGTRPIPTIGQQLKEELGLAASEDSIAAFLRRLKEMGLAERTFEERRLLLTESRRRDRRSRLQGHGSTLLRMRFSLGDPDRLFDRLVRTLPFFWTPGFVAISVGVFLLLLVILIANWPAFHLGLMQMYDPSGYTGAKLASVYGGMLLVVAFHELGHGLTCKHFGGEVHEIGAMVIYLMPAFYCNVNDAWMFERRSHRLWVTFAGTWIQLVVAACASVVWVSTRPGSGTSDFAFNCMLIGGGLTVLLNFNPLIPLDGYYALMDLLELPNLRPRSFAYLSAVTQRFVLRRDVRPPAVTPREHRIFLAYAIPAVLYGATLLGGTLFILGRLLVQIYGDWGWALIVAAGWILVRKPLLRLGARARTAWIEHRSQGRVLLRYAYAGLAAAGLILGSCVAPWTLRARGSAVVEPARRMWLRSDQAGVLDDILVSEGQSVRFGQVLAIVRDPQLEIQRERSASRVALLKRQDAQLRADGALAEEATTDVQLRGERALLGELDARRSTLLLRAPFAGTIATPHLEERLGAAVTRGDSVLEVWDSRALRIRLYLPAGEAGGLEPGDPVRIRFPSAAQQTLTGSVQSIAPAADAATIEAIARLRPERVDMLRPGMVGRAKVDVGRASVAVAVGRALRRTIRLDWFL